MHAICHNSVSVSVDELFIEELVELPAILDSL